MYVELPPSPSSEASARSARSRLRCLLRSTAIQPDSSMRLPSNIWSRREARDRTLEQRGLVRPAGDRRGGAHDRGPARASDYARDLPEAHPVGRVTVDHARAVTGAEAQTHRGGVEAHVVGASLGDVGDAEAAPVRERLAPALRRCVQVADE